MKITIEFNELRDFQYYNQFVANKQSAQLRIILTWLVLIFTFFFCLFIDFQFDIARNFQIENDLITFILLSIFITILSRVYIINKLTKNYENNFIDQKLNSKYQSILKDINGKLDVETEILRKYLNFFRNEKDYIFARYSKENLNLGIAEAIKQYFEYRYVLNPNFLKHLRIERKNSKRYFICHYDEFFTDILNAYPLKDTFFDENVAIELNKLHIGGLTKDWTGSPSYYLDIEIKGKTYGQYQIDFATNIDNNIDYLISIIKKYKSNLNDK